MKPLTRLIFVLVPILLLSGCMGCTNPDTDAGYVGYVYKQPIFGQKRFYDLQTGPASTGFGWRLFVWNVSVTPTTETEQFENNASVLSIDNLQIGFEAHLIFLVRPDRVRQFVEQYNEGTNKDGDLVAPAYIQFIQQPFRTIARDEVHKYPGLDIKDKTDIIGQAISDRLSDYLKNTPFKVIQAVVGNIQYPQAVANAVSAKLATTQQLEQEKTQVAIQQVKAQQRVAEAHGIADAMQIINNELTPLYIQHEAIQAQEKMVNSQNHTEVYVPVGPMGVPIVGNLQLGQR